MVGDNKVRILPESHQLHRLRATLLVEHNRIGHQVRGVLVGRVDVDFHEDEDAVVCGNLHTAKFRARHTIDIDTVIGLLAAGQRDIDLHRYTRRIAHCERART